MEKSILKEFLSKVVERTKNIKVGDPMNPDTQMGALISEEHLHKVLEYVDTAKKEVKKQIYIQLFQERLSYQSVKGYVTMSKGIMDNAGGLLLD